MIKILVYQASHKKKHYLKQKTYLMFGYVGCTVSKLKSITKEEFVFMARK